MLNGMIEILVFETDEYLWFFGESIGTFEGIFAVILIWISLFSSNKIITTVMTDLSFMSFIGLSWLFKSSNDPGGRFGYNVFLSCSEWQFDLFLGIIEAVLNRFDMMIFILFFYICGRSAITNLCLDWGLLVEYEIMFAEIEAI